MRSCRAARAWSPRPIAGRLWCECCRRWRCRCRARVTEKAKRVDSMRLLACELHANRSAVFGPDHMTGLNFQRIQETCDVGGELAGAPAVPGRLGRGAEARQVETNDTVLVRQMRHPRDPGARGLGVAMHHHDGLGNAPWFAEPIVLVSDPYARPDLHLLHSVAPICGPALWA